MISFFCIFPLPYSHSSHSPTLSILTADLQKQIEEDLLLCLNLPSTFVEPGKNEKEVTDLRSEIAIKQEQHLGLCTEKVLLARQAYELVSIPRWLTSAKPLTM